jgi:hypothetical protein
MTATGNDIGDLFDMTVHSPMLLDYPDPPITIPETPPDFFRDLPLSVSGGADYALTSTVDWPLPTPMTSRSPPPPNCCFAIALDILARLFSGAPAGCTLPCSDDPVAPAQARTIDSILSENRHIIESVTSLLDCPCSQDEYLVSLITLIALKVMGWYAAAADDPHPRPHPSSTSSSSSSSTTPPSPIAPFSVSMHTSWPSSGSVSPADTSRRPSTSTSATSVSGSPHGLTEQVLRLPAVAGGYRLSDQQQGRIAAQLVLSELHRVQRLVSALTQRLESIRLRARASQEMGCELESGGVGERRGGGGGARTPPFSVPTFCQLEEDLRKRLRALSSETIDVLRRA